jgi:hypothetical protein
VVTEPGSGLLVARSPLALGARTRWAPGSFPIRLPVVPENSGPSHGLRLPFRVSDRSLRPTRLRVDSSHGVHRPYDDATHRSGSPGLASPGTFRPQGFDPLVGLLPARGTRSEDREPSLGFTLQGLIPSSQPHPFPGRDPLAVSGSPCLLL